jgi:hypothetical protein
MKKVYLFPSLLFIFISFVGFAKQVDVDFASAIATKFIQQNQLSSKRSAVTLTLHYTSVQDVSLEQNKRAGAKK